MARAEEQCVGPMGKGAVLCQATREEIDRLEEEEVELEVANIMAHHTKEKMTLLESFTSDGS